MTEQKLQAGFARKCITPPEPMGMTGYGNDQARIFTEIRDDLYATCVAFRQCEDTILMFTLDLLTAVRKITDPAREAIAAATGVPAERIMFCGTHTHSGPVLWTPGPYFDLVIRAATDAAREAIADLSPAEPVGAKGILPGINFVRHYKLANGTYAGPNFGDFKSAPIVDHAHPNDPQLQVVYLKRDGKKDIGLINWQAHPCYTGGVNKTVLSADFICPVRQRFEAQTGAYCAYFTGAAGDQTTDSRLEHLKHDMDCDQYGHTIADFAVELLKNAQSLAREGVRNNQTWLTQPLNHAEEDMLPQAQMVVDLWRRDYDRPAATKVARANGFESVYHAVSVVRRTTRPETATMELNTLRVGDLAFVTVPFEMFNAHGRFVKDNSPYPITFVCTTANDYMHYIPTVEAFDYRCYESCQASFAKGTGEIVAQTLVDMLHSIQ